MRFVIKNQRSENVLCFQIVCSSVTLITLLSLIYKALPRKERYIDLEVIQLA